MLTVVQELVEDALASATPEAATTAFRARLKKRLRPSYLQVRRYRRPPGVLTSDRHWQAGGVLLRDARPGWEESEGFRYICFECNPLLAAVGEGRTRYRFADFAPREDRRYRDYWDALASAGIGEGVGANAYGAQQGVASVHLGLDAARVEPEVRQTCQLAGAIVAEHLLALGAPFPAAPAAAGLTPRERDVMRFVAEGKTDWEIGVILTVSEATARFHADNARRKLRAVNRAHAVARFIAIDGVR